MNSTRRKFGFAILILFGFSLLAVVLLSLINRSQQEQFAEYSRAQVKGAAASITEIYEVQLYWVAYDYTLWDELIDYVNAPDTAWANSNLANILYWFDLDGLWLFDKHGALIYQDVAGCANALPADFFSDMLLSELHDERLLHTYVVSNDSLMLIQGATLHPTLDTERQAEPAGFFFVSKCWDEEILSLLQTLTGSEILIESGANTETLQGQDNTSEVRVPYLNHNEEVVAYLAFSKSIDFAELLSKNSSRAFFLLLITMLVSLLMYYIAVQKWVNKPLKQIKSIIQSNDTREVPALKRNSSDFEQIGDLIEQFIQLKDELEVQKNRAEESAKLKTAFLANMSHEIRTPLNGILGFLELLKEPDLEPEKRDKFIDLINISGSRLLDTINDILEVSMIDTGQVAIRLSTVNTEELMLYNLYFFRQQAEKKGLEFRLTHYLTDHKALIQTDKHKLDGILTNLLKNAIKFTDEGVIEFGNFIDKNFLVFYVKDTGEGIPADRIESVFERFVQVDFDYTRKHEGSGLGLSIVRSYVEMLGGKVWAESALGKGSTFYFTLPYVTEEAKKAE